ncbi:MULTISPECIES: hypothetical protein [Mycobacterium]|uniref:Uncharacterized protein n=1 Tax=Mycobacterium syngnathidarum TaxID=1908205 RepID=A0A1Q9WHM1_9MYCO|nr:MULTISPECIES: hypothetical protein [Mycobacterium]MCG7606840.1 hypothetical protein [Mycobacterium sp. CnD-18-1]OHT92539.1 hypothetical protein BKG61_23825 [Mycobacterium syngnathidarum]OLT98225.1 hypothetical protein BKG60_01965 [Mycobacterium syngnathidarum]
MGISLLPFTRLSDADVAGALDHAVAVINPVIDVFTRFDPLGLRRRTHREDPGKGPVGKSLDVAAALLNFAELPGTKAWAEMDQHGHVKWWVHRAGAVTTIFVAFPGAFGVIADRLGVQDVLGFTNQALVLCAVAREDGVDYDDQVQLLGAVLCDRQLSAASADDIAAASPSLPAKLWEFAGTLRAVGDELTKRPRPQKLYRYLGMLPGVGAVADYFGEFSALVHAADEGAAWISEHSRQTPAPSPART